MSAAKLFSAFNNSGGYGYTLLVRRYWSALLVGAAPLYRCTLDSGIDDHYRWLERQAAVRASGNAIAHFMLNHHRIASHGVAFFLPLLCSALVRDDLGCASASYATAYRLDRACDDAPERAWRTGDRRGC